MKKSYHSRNRRVLSILSLLFLFMIPLSIAKQSVEKSKFTISSDDVFYCTNIYDGEGRCLIRAIVTLENKNIPKLLEYNFTTSTDVSLRGMYLDGVKRESVSAIGKEFITKEKYVLDSQSSVMIEFFASQSGKFDFSIKGSGIELTLDPYYNISVNVTNPSYYLSNNSVYSVSDNNFTKTAISNELSDQNTATNFSLIFESLSIENQTTFRDTDGLDDSNTVDLAANNDAFMGEFNFTQSSRVLSNARFCILSNTVTGTPKINISLTNTTATAPIQLNGITPIASSWSCADIDKKYLHFLSNRQSILMGISCSSCDGGNKFKLRRDGNNAPLITYSGTYSFNYGQAPMTNITFTYNTSEFKGNALSLLFNITLNEGLRYWLSVNKLNSGSVNSTIYTYVNESDINLTHHISQSISIGNTPIEITSIIKNGSISRFRMITSSASIISESYLIEEQSDFTPPLILNCEVNDTSLGCNGSVRMSCNVTDDTSISSVTIGYEDTTQHSSNALNIPLTNTYYTDVFYPNFSIGNASYFFLNVSAKDIFNQTSISYPTIEYFHNCIEYTSPVIQSLLPVNGTMYNFSVGIVEVNFSCIATDDQSLKNMSVYLRHPPSTFWDSLGSIVFLNTTPYYALNISYNESEGEDHEFYCEAYDNESKRSISSINHFTSILTSPEQLFSVDSCVKSLETSFLRISFILIAFVMFILGIWMRSPIISALGGLMMLFNGFYLFPCSQSLGIIMSALGVVFTIIGLIGGGRR